MSPRTLLSRLHEPARTHTEEAWRAASGARRLRVGGSRRLVGWVGILGIVLFSGCNKDELQRLRDENARLKEELANKKDTTPNLAQIEEFTIGLAPAEKNFDEGAFNRHLRTSLQESSLGNSKFSISGENEPEELAKLRDILIQQYLASKKVPIRISNLTYKLKDPKADFKLGGSVIPRDGLVLEKGSDNLIRFNAKDPFVASMDREDQDKYSIAYEDSQGNRGAIPLVLRDVDVLNPSQSVQAARQGDVSFNWQVSLEQVHAYRVSNFSGDVGSFVRKMRYPEGGLNQYQTVRDSIFLFGYGPYQTNLVNRLETPRFIDRVEVAAISPGTFEQLAPGMEEEKVLENTKEGQGGWASCNFVEFTAEKKIWERPPTVGFPFLSRQVSQDKNKVFYMKYDQKGPVLVGDFSLKGR